MMNGVLRNGESRFCFTVRQHPAGGRSQLSINSHAGREETRLKNNTFTAIIDLLRQ